MLFLFSFVSQQILNFLSVSLCEINFIKIQTMSLASKSMYFSRDFLCFIYFDIIIRQRLNQKCGFRAAIDTGHAQRFYLTMVQLLVAQCRPTFK